MGCEECVSIRIIHSAGSGLPCRRRCIPCRVTGITPIRRMGSVAEANIVGAFVNQNNGSAGRTQGPKRPTNVYQVVIGYPESLLIFTNVLAVTDVV